MYEINWYRLDEHREISDFITCAEYQLFIDEMRAQEEFHQPAHWVDYQFPKGQALQPILGIRGENAQEFCNWLNRNKNNEINYRLPTVEESQTFIPQDSFQLANWCQEWENFSLFWNTKEQEEYIKKHCSQFSAQPILLNYNFLYFNFNSFDHARALARALDLDHALHLAHAALDLDHALDHALDRALDHALDRALALDHALAHALDRALDHALDHALAHALDRALDHDAISSLQQQVQNRLVSEINPYLKKYLILLNYLLKTFLAKNHTSQLIEWRNYLATLAKYAYEGFTELKYLEEEKGLQIIKVPWWQFWKKNTEFILTGINNYSKGKQAMLSLHWWLTITNARMEGKLPAWEGLRIVREKKF